MTDINNIGSANAGTNPPAIPVTGGRSAGKPKPQGPKPSTPTTSGASHPTDVGKAVSKANASLSHTSVRFEVDSDSNVMIVKLVDKETNEVIRQIPSESMLEVAKRIASILENYSGGNAENVSIFGDL